MLSPCVFGNVSSITLSTSGDMRVTAECRVAPFPTVLTLRNTRVHVHTTDSSYVSAICQVHLSGKHISMVHSLSTIKACLPWWPPFSQHASWQWCNHLGIPSFMTEILLFNSVFHGGVTPVSVSTLKPPLRVIVLWTYSLGLEIRTTLILEKYKRTR